MRERLDQFLKFGCFALGALVLFQVGRAVVRNNPFERVNIPEVPTLATGTNAPMTETNAPAAKIATAVSGTNATGGSNVAVATKVVAATNAAMETNGATGTNILSGITLTNGAKAGTNSVAAQDAGKGSNAVLRAAHPPDMAMMGMPGAPRKLPDLPPAARARVDRITESEILGPVIRPMPMALLGLAGNTAFLRTASGQTGLVKEGDSLGDLKLLRIGINRVLVEQGGQKKELTIFSGYGGDSLLIKPKETPDDTTPK